VILLPGAVSQSPDIAAEAEAIRFVLQIGEQGTGPGQLHGPIAIAMNARDELFITDAHNARVQRFDTEGTFQASGQLS
jgi:hypothetical protein